MQPTLCVPNIGPAQRRRRAVVGVVFAAITVAVATPLIAYDAARPLRLVVAIPSVIAALGFFQARAQTCVALAARGLRNMDDGDRPMDDEAQLRAVQAQSRRVYLEALIATLVVTVLVLWL